MLSFFDTGQSLLVDFGLCAPTRVVFFHICQSLLVDFGLCASTRLVFFDIGQSLLVDFDLRDEWKRTKGCNVCKFMQIYANEL